MANVDRVESSPVLQIRLKPDTHLIRREAALEEAVRHQLSNFAPKLLLRLEECYRCLLQTPRSLSSSAFRIRFS